MLCGVAALLLPAFRQAQDPNIALCAKYMYNDVQTLKTYAQDYDEIFPTWIGVRDFDDKVLPYRSVFTYMFACPSTHKHYHISSGIKGASLYSIADPSTFEAMRDSAPHPDGLISIATLDGRVYHGGTFVGNTNDLCLDNIKTVDLSVIMYAQDYDEVLPPMNSFSQTSNLIHPYLKSTSYLYCPITGSGYQFNAAIGGTSLAQYNNTADVWVVEDSVPHPADGVNNIGYLDGTTSQKGNGQYPLPGDTTKRCIDNIRQLSLGIDLYTQDYDQTLPNMTTTDMVISATYPYIKKQSDYICPQTGMKYIYNANLSGRTLFSFTNLDSYWMITDAAAHPDGQRTTGYLSGIVIHPGYNYPIDLKSACISAVKQDGLATSMYAQDYDETLPPMLSALEYGHAISPYLRSYTTLLCPYTGLSYQPNPAYSNVGYAQIATLADTVILKDAKIHPDGGYTYGYADGHARGYLIPRIGFGSIKRSSIGSGNSTGRP